MIMGYSEVTSQISAMAVVISARGGTRRQRGAAIAAEVRRWAPERLAQVRVSHADTEVYHHPLTTTIRYARNDSHLVVTS